MKFCDKLTFSLPGWYLKFSLRFMKNVGIIWTEKDKIIKEMAFCGKWNRDYVDCLKNAVNFVVAEIYRTNF